MSLLVPRHATARFQPVTTSRVEDASAGDRASRHSVRERLQQQLGDRFVITRELAGGGLAQVFLATEVALGRPVVLKALPTELAAGVDAERFHREIVFAAQLQHPHLVPLLAASVSDGESPESDQAQGNAQGRPIPWFSMPWIQGQTLREYMRPGQPLPLPDGLRLLREIASGLSYAHARGIVHRDIKPENVLLCDGVAMVTDFGVAKSLDDASNEALQTGKRVTTVTMMLGTPAYMAPEQVSSARLVDHKADIYAFGCMAYEVLTGAPPLAKASLRATMVAQVTEAPVEISQHRRDLPASLAEVLMQCLHKDPMQRPHSASVIVKAIDALHAVPESTRNPIDSGVGASGGASSAVASPAVTLPASSGKASTEGSLRRQVLGIVLLCTLVVVIAAVIRTLRPP